MTLRCVPWLSPLLSVSLTKMDSPPVRAGIWSILMLGVLDGQHALSIRTGQWGGACGGDAGELGHRRGVQTGSPLSVVCVLCTSLSRRFTSLASEKRRFHYLSALGEWGKASVPFEECPAS